MNPDPSLSVQIDVLPHLHLVSNHKYPARARIELGDATRWLREAPQVANDKAAFYWSCIDRPQDGTTHLVWQPLQRRGITPATDGYIWTTPEQCYQQDVGGGAILEMYYHRAGYAFGEPVTCHTRRRFRLIPAPNIQNQAVNPSLWIIHWGASDPADRLPANQFPPSQKVIKDIESRNSLRLLSRKDFMLRDHAHWPTITKDGNPQAPPQMSMPRMPPQLAYQPPPAHTHMQFAPVPAQRKGRGQQQAAAEADEEDVRGDFFDAITPRDIALERYKRSHDWIEEVVASHHAMSQIIPPDMGFGRTGELSKLTDGIFEAPEADKVGKNPYVGRLPAGLAEEFKNRVMHHVDETQSEIEKIKAEHEKNMASFKASAVVKETERALRTESDAGALEERLVAQVEAHVGKKVQELKAVDRIQAGGYCPATDMDQTADAGADADADVDVDMGDTVGSLLDQMGTAPSVVNSSAGFPTPHAQLGRSATGTPRIGTPQTAPDQGTGSASGASQPPQATHQPRPQPHTQQQLQLQQLQQPHQIEAQPQHLQAQPQQPQQLQQMAPVDNTSLAFDAANDFDDLNTAGEALDGYGSSGDMGMGMDMDMNSFGEAFSSGMSANASGAGDGHGTDM